MKVKKFILDGKNFSNIEDFYDEAQKVLTDDFKGFGRNLDAFDDILYGGFGKFESEKIIIVWQNFDQSKKELPSEFLKKIIEIIKNHKNIKLQLNKKLGEK